MSNIRKYNLSENTFKFIELNNFKNLTDIQDRVLNKMLDHKDIIGISATGTGKTHAFLIPLFEMIDSNSNQVQAVITAPTRELATQIYEFATLYEKVDDRIKIQLVTGGQDRERMKDRLENQPHLVIGTPGRIKDMFIDAGVLRIDQAKIMVIDEADMTIEYGFIEDVDAIAARMPDDLQMVAFSATMEENLEHFLEKYMQQPSLIEIKDDSDFGPNIDHILIDAKHKKYEEVLVDFLKTINPYVCLIFANTREHATETTQHLRQSGYKVLEFHGGLTSRERNRALRQIQSHEFTYIVASDIAARGLDIEGITHVVSLGMPYDLDFYFHRAGRTGRTSRHGTAYTIFKRKDIVDINALQKRGVEFRFQAIRGDQLVNTKNTLATKKKNHYEEDIEIANVLHRKNQKVKPGYKKKRKREIERIKQRRKREMIRKNIQQQKKERAIEEQKEKNRRNK